MREGLTGVFSLGSLDAASGTLAAIPRVRSGVGQRSTLGRRPSVMLGVLAGVAVFQVRDGVASGETGAAGPIGAAAIVPAGRSPAVGRSPMVGRLPSSRDRSIAAISREGVGGRLSATVGVVGIGASGTVGGMAATGGASGATAAGIAATGAVSWLKRWRYGR
ncbi:MAG: hypothetical protein ACK5XO_09435 [Phycisphaerales bacterium]